jgi:hypothetical protein
VAERPRRRDPGEVGPPRGARRARGVRTPARSVVALSASSGPPWDVRPTGRADIQRPRVRCPGVRCPGVRGIQVSGRTGSGVRGAAAGLSVPRWTLEWLGVAGRPGRAQRVDVPPWPVGGVVACLHRAGRQGDAAALAVAGSHEVDRSQGRRLAGVPAAAPSWPQRADTGAGPGPGCQSGGGGSMGPSRCSPAPAGRPGQVVGVVLTKGPGPGGGDHAGWSLGEGGPVASSSGGPTGFGGGAGCGRGAAAARTERCPLGADRSLTCENSGGRDRV